MTPPTDTRDRERVAAKGWVIVGIDEEGDRWLASPDIYDTKDDAEGDIAEMIADDDADNYEGVVLTVEPIGRAAPGGAE